MNMELSHVISSISLPVWLVIITLLLMGVASVFVTVERLLFLNKARNQSRDLAMAVATAFKEGDGDKALKIVRSEQYSASYLGHMLSAGLAEFTARPDQHGVEAVGRALERTSVVEGQDLRRWLSILATTGSTAPFVGLVGTIMGIISAFQGMAESGSGGLGAVSAGIAEALITTAFGIAIAIVAVWAFNYFTGKIDDITNDISVTSQELLDWCEKQLLPAFQAAK
jgi:biopolymer transport protein ExbB/TolQ